MLLNVSDGAQHKRQREAKLTMRLCSYNDVAVTVAAACAAAACRCFVGKVIHAQRWSLVMAPAVAGTWLWAQ